MLQWIVGDRQQLFYSHLIHLIGTPESAQIKINITNPDLSLTSFHMSHKFGRVYTVSPPNCHSAAKLTVLVTKPNIKKLIYIHIGLILLYTVNIISSSFHSIIYKKQKTRCKCHGFYIKTSNFVIIYFPFCL